MADDWEFTEENAVQWRKDVAQQRLEIFPNSAIGTCGIDEKKNGALHSYFDKDARERRKEEESRATPH